MINARVFGLKFRKGSTVGSWGGTFRFFDRETGEMLLFQWDGAAIDKDGSIVLIEEELCSPSSLHIQGHISRLVIMLHFKHNVKTLLWVTNDQNYPVLKKIVKIWVKFFSKACNIKLPTMEYCRPDGSLFIMNKHLGEMR